MLINLIENAIKFTPADGAVTVQACRMPADPGRVCGLSVVDTGCGIKPEGAALIFERLYQDPNAPDSSRKGLGWDYSLPRSWSSCTGEGSGLRATLARKQFLVHPASVIRLPRCCSR